MKLHWIIWIPRLLMVFLAVFMMLFSLDVFEMKTSIWNKILGLLIHNIPSLLMLLVLIFTWKKPLFGGVFFLVLGVLMTVFFKFYHQWETLLIFTAPLLIAGIIFMIVHRLEDKNQPEIHQAEPI